MENLQTLNCRITPQWKCKNPTSFCKTLNPFKPKTLFTPLSSSLHRISPSQTHHNPPSYTAAATVAAPLKRSSSTDHTTLLVESYHQTQRLKSLIEKLRKRGSNALQILRDDGDWSKDQFWAVVRFLIRDSRSTDVLQVFDFWKNKESSRINEVNYDRIIRLLSEGGLMKKAVFCLQEMKEHGLSVGLETYNSVIHGFARIGSFGDATFFLNEMREMNLVPDTKTYDGLIEAYGKYKMYDEIGGCMKMMEMDGCKPDQYTYNLLIREFARGGLLKRMEKMYQSLISKRMHLQASTLVSVLEAYANFRILGMMEKVYRRALNSRIPLKEDLIRKVAAAYIENYMFSRLDDIGYDLSLINNKSDLGWCLRLLSHACISSKKGMGSILEKMEVENVPWSVTIANTILLACLKMRDLKHLKFQFLELSTRHIKPDMVSLGILYDAKGIGFDGTTTAKAWKRMGLLDEPVQINTDPLVLLAFGKGHFVKNCEEMYCSLEAGVRENTIWTYQMLINRVSEQSEPSGN